MTVGVIGFLTLIINAKILGAVGVGTIGLIVLSVTIGLLLCNLINTSIIFFFNKLSRIKMLSIAYTWTFFSVLVIYLLSQYIEFIPNKLHLWVIALVIFESLISIHTNLLVGKEEIKRSNVIVLVKVVSFFVTLNILFFLFEKKEVVSFCIASLFSNVISFFLAVYLSSKLIKSEFTSSTIQIFKQMISYGYYLQIANIFQLLNYRLSYYILDFYSGRAMLGIYSAGVQISEALFIPARSIGNVQYARISAKRKEKYAQNITLLLAKVSLAVTTSATVVLLLIPTFIYRQLLGNEFSEIKQVLLFMGLGIIALSVEIILSRYFSGTGKQQKNSFSAFIGFLLTLIFALILIPKYGFIGAAITTSISYLGMFLYLYFNFRRQQRISLKSFLLSKHEIKLFKRVAFKK